MIFSPLPCNKRWRRIFEGNKMQWDVDGLDKTNIFHQWSRLVKGEKKSPSFENNDIVSDCEHLGNDLMLLDGNYSTQSM